MDEHVQAWGADDIRKLDKSYRRNLINCLSGFKSACLLGSQSLSGVNNLALFSQVFHVGANPPLMGVLFRPQVVPRHSLENVRANRFFTLNHVHQDIYPQAHQTSARYDADESEFDAVGLEAEMLPGFSAPFVKEAHIKIGLIAKEFHTILANQTQLVVGEVVSLSIPSKAVGEDGFVYLDRLNTVTISGLDRYHKTEALERLPYAKK
ncbi:MAG: flavin reductase family protein [Bacteroidia bacterium]